MWIVLSIVSAAFASLVAILGKIGIAKLDTTLATTVRAIVMAVFLIAASLALGKFQFIHDIESKAFLYIALSGVAGALSWIFYFWALKLGPASGVAALDRLSVVFVLIFAVIFLAESLSWKSATGAALIAIGAILMTLR